MAARSCFRFPRRRVLAASLAAALAVIAFPRETPAAVLPVTSCADDGSPGTLRSVMYSAHDFDVVDLTHLTCSTITLTQGEIDTSWEGYYHSVDYLTVVGPGRQLTISGGNSSQVLKVGGSSWYGYFSLSDITIADGWNEAGQPGCLDSLRGVLVLTRVAFDNCHARSYPAPVGPYLPRPAGAIRAELLFANQITVTNSSYTAFYQNVASGGGIWIGGLGVLTDSTISGNVAQAQTGYDDFVFQSTGGGGIYSAGGPLVLINSTVSGNSVEATNPGENGVGGGIFSRSIATIIGSTISGNTVDGDGGGIYKRPFGLVFDNQTTLTIQNSTITGNSAGGTGGGVLSQRPTWIANSTIAGNQSTLGGALMFTRTGGYPGAGVLDLESTIIAGNTAGPAPAYALDLATDDVLAVTGSHSLVMDAAAGIVLPPDTLQTDPLLLPLADNGGLVWTMALAPGSPAIDAGSNPLGLHTDARGSPWVRTFGPAPDIGAYEVQPPPDPLFANGFDP